MFKHAREGNSDHALGIYIPVLLAWLSLCMLIYEAAVIQADLITDFYPEML